MYKKVILLSTILFSCILMVSCVKASSAQEAHISPTISISPVTHELIMPDNIYQVFMKGSKNGWAITGDGIMISTNNAWKSYKQSYQFISNAKAISKPAIFYTDGTLFVIGFLSETSMIGIYRSSDERTTWEANYLDYSDNDYGTNQLYCSFMDSHNGYLLYCGGAALGQMPKILYETVDGGKTFQKVGDISYINGYPTGMTFKDGIGYISTTYHGNDNSYLYTSNNQGKSWDTLTLQLPKNINSTSSEGYIDGYPPYFTDEKGYMILKYVGKQTVFIIYQSSDGGKMWDPIGSINGLQTVSNYSFGDENTVYIIDDSGVLSTVNCTEPNF